MTTRNFYLNMGEDRLLFQSIKFDSITGNLEEEMLSTMFNCLSLNPSVIDVTNLGYMPMVGDIWNGKDFIGNNGISEKQQPLSDIGNCSFSFIVGDTHSFYCSYPGNAESNIIIAALSSNPIITLEDIDV